MDWSGKCVFRKWWEVGCGGRVGEALALAGFNQGPRGRGGSLAQRQGSGFMLEVGEQLGSRLDARCAVMGWGQQEKGRRWAM